MDDKCKEALVKMNLSHLIGKFAENNMDYNALILLKEFPDAISSIVPTLRDVLMLRKGLQNLEEDTTPCNASSLSEGEFILPVISLCQQTSFQTENVNTNEQRGSQEIILNPEVCHNQRIIISSEGEERTKEKRHPGEKNYISETLESSAIGKSILALYRESGLDNTSRCKLAELLIHAEYGANPNTLIGRARFLELSKLVVELMPEECPETYYIPSYMRRRGRSASGKLYDAYVNLNKILRKTKLRRNYFDKPPSDPEPSWGESCSSSPFPSQQEDSTYEVKRKLEFIRTHFEPWDEFKACWESTTFIRQRQLREDSKRENKVAEYMERYPMLKQPGGFILLEIDFAELFEEAQNNWVTKWPLFSQKLKEELLKIGVKEDRLDCDAALLYELPKLFGIIPIRTPGKKPWRATRSEIQEGFLVHLKEIDDLQKTMEGIRETAQYRGTKVHLIPLIVGKSLKNIISSYVIIDDRTFPVESPLRAVEIAFKAYHALNCPYPIQSARMWHLLSEAVFGLQGIWKTFMEASPDTKRLIQTLQC